VAAQSGVTGPLVQPNEEYLGFPAVKRADALRRYGAFAKLPDMREEIKALKAEIAELQARLDKLSSKS
jgi:UDP-3-O-[3-hydroxymyristoyl] glucosamine N-acyltransferase